MNVHTTHTHREDKVTESPSSQKPQRLLSPYGAASTALKWEIPYWTWSDIGVTCCHLANHWVQSSIFMNFKEVSWWREDWGLISILHNNFDCCCILKGSPATEPWVDVDIGCLHLQCIGFFGLKVQRLLKKNDKDECFSLNHSSKNKWV